MPKKLAIDWDDRELRLVAAQCSGNQVKVTHAAVIPIGDSGVAETLRSTIASHDLESTETFVAIGRGKAELRELQLPPVPDDELPDMVRFQAIRNFASSGDRATVDYLVTRRNEQNVELIAAAVDPDSLTKIREACGTAELSISRIGLRPLAAAALYLTRGEGAGPGDTVLIDLLSDDAEIVVARDGNVIFVRTVRLPSVATARPKALGGELKRSLVACGSSGSLSRVILWGRASVHQEDVTMLAEASGSEVQVLDPFDLVDINASVRSSLPDHVGRLAPLVGLIAADESNGQLLIDFLNPRKKVEEKPNQLKQVAMIGAPIAAALLIGFFGYRHLKNLDARVALLEKANADLQPEVDEASTRQTRTERVDQFLDVNVNWLSEMRRLAQTMPASEQMIVRTISASGDIRNGGGTLQVSGGVSDPDVIEVLEESLRDEMHRVVGDGSTFQATGDDYKWTARESISLTAETVRNQRYAGLSPEALGETDEASGDGEEPSGNDDETIDKTAAEEPMTEEVIAETGGADPETETETEEVDSKVEEVASEPESTEAAEPADTSDPKPAAGDEGEEADTSPPDETSGDDTGSESDESTAPAATEETPADTAETAAEAVQTEVQS